MDVENDLKKKKKSVMVSYGDRLLSLLLVIKFQETSYCVHLKKKWQLRNAVPWK